MPAPDETQRESLINRFMRELPERKDDAGQSGEAVKETGAEQDQGHAAGVRETVLPETQAGIQNQQHTVGQIDVNHIQTEWDVAMLGQDYTTTYTVNEDGTITDFKTWTIPTGDKHG